MWRNTLLSVVKQEMTGWGTGESTWKQIVSKLSGSIRRWGNEIKWFWSKSVRRVEPLHVSCLQGCSLTYSCTIDLFTLGDSSEIKVAEQFLWKSECSLPSTASKK